MTIEAVHQAYMVWQLAVGSYEYARHQGDGELVAQAERVMLDRYAAYLLTRDHWEKGVMPAV